MRISIITVSYNSEKYIRETIESVLRQSYDNIEYIIIDGKSNDSTIDIIKEYASRISYWASEQDRSMYDAINKGLKKVTGDYIMILNSDDLLADDCVIETFVKNLQPDIKGYYGNLIKLYSHGELQIKLFQTGFRQLLYSEHGTFIPHPTLIISKEILNVLPEYDLQYRYASDYDYILKILNQGFFLKHMDIWITKFRHHPSSITSSGKIDDERKIILRKFGLYKIPLFYRKVHFYYGWLLYKIINKFRTRLK